MLLIQIKLESAVLRVIAIWIKSLSLCTVFSSLTFSLNCLCDVHLNRPSDGPSSVCLSAGERAGLQTKQKTLISLNEPMTPVAQSWLFWSAATVTSGHFFVIGKKNGCYCWQKPAAITQRSWNLGQDQQGSRFSVKPPVSHSSHNSLQALEDTGLCEQ